MLEAIQCALTSWRCKGWTLPAALQKLNLPLLWSCPGHVRTSIGPLVLLHFEIHVFSILIDRELVGPLHILLLIIMEELLKHSVHHFEFLENA